MKNSTIKKSIADLCIWNISEKQNINELSKELSKESKYKFNPCYECNGYNTRCPNYEPRGHNYE